MRLFWVFFLLVAFAAPAQAQNKPKADLQGLKIVVPEARGKKKWGRAQLTRQLRRTLSAEVGPLIPSRNLKRAQRKLKQRGRKKYRPDRLAKAGRTIGAQYVLSVKITKKRWLYTARAVLINTKTGETDMDFRSQYFKPKKEAADRGKRIGKRTLLKLAELIGDQNQVVAAAPPVAPPPPATEPPPPSEPPPSVAPPPPSEPPPSTEPPPSAPPPPSEPPPPAPPAAPPPNQVVTAPPPSATPSAGTTVQPKTASSSEFFRAALGGGAGLLRTYSVASSALSQGSSLSYQLSPLSLVTLELEGTIPSLGVALVVGGSFRPVRYSLELSQLEPRGSMINGYVAIGYQIPISGHGNMAYKIIPRIGTQFGLYSVQDNPGPVVLGATVVGVGAGVGARLPINEVLEVNLGVDGSGIPVYSERPSTTGNSARGFAVGGDLGARIWLTEMVAIALDSRFVFERISLSGPPNRATPEDEEEALKDATITTKDLRASLGVAFRI